LSRRYCFRNTEILIDICRNVYDPSDDTFLILENASPHGDILEIGSGSGIISVFFAKRGFHVKAVDINPEAVNCTLHNARLNDVSLEATAGDLFNKVPERYDTVIFNPPYLPTEDNFGGSEQWDGGSDGFRVTRPFLRELPGHLKSGGICFLILSSLTDVDSLISEFQKLSFKEVASSPFTFETLFLYSITIKD
jgi:release factor glutamine methyltransferase